MNEVAVMPRKFQPLVWLSTGGYTGGVGFNANRWNLTASLTWARRLQVWSASTTYAANQRVIPPVRNSYTYTCSIAGTSAASEPPWSKTLGGTFLDGTTLQWTCTEDCGLAKLYQANIVSVQFYAYGITVDRTANYEIVIWPGATPPPENPILGVSLPVSQSQGLLIADGVVTFNSGTSIAKHPVTGATADWYPGYTITETLTDFSTVVNVQAASDTHDQAAILKFSDLLFGDSMGIQFDTISNSEATVMAVLHLAC